MPLPRWMARSVSRYMNPGVLKKESWPVLVHVGRKSGRTYRTPIGAEPIEGGYLFFVNYGPQTDWRRNVMAAGSASLESNGEVLTLTNPRIIPIEDASSVLTEATKTPPGWVGIEECLVTEVDTAPVPHEG